MLSNEEFVFCDVESLDGANIERAAGYPVASRREVRGVIRERHITFALRERRQRHIGQRQKARQIQTMFQSVAPRDCSHLYTSFRKIDSTRLHQQNVLPRALASRHMA